MKKKFFFDHIYKAGGSSIERALLHWLDGAGATHLLIETATAALRRYADKALVTGHFSFSPGQWLDPERYALTMLRHPVDRIVSHYYFAKDLEPRGGDLCVELTKSCSFEQYVRSDVPEVRNLLENFQVRHYLPLTWDGVKALSPDDQLEAAKQALGRYDLVGVFGEYEDFLAVLAIEAGWMPLEQIPRVNVTAKRPRLDELDASTREYLEQLNRLDIALYEYARALFQAKRRAVLRRCGTLLLGRARDGVAPAAGGPSPASPPLTVGGPKPADYGNRRIELVQASLSGDGSLGTGMAFSGEMVSLRVDFRAHQPAENLVLGIAISDGSGRLVFGTNSRLLGRKIQITEPGDYYGEFRFRCDLGPDQYQISAALHSPDGLTEKTHHWRDEIASFTVAGNVGYYAEGLVKLYPTLQCGSLAASPPQGLSLLDATENWSLIQRLALHTPSLTDFRSAIRLLSAIETMKPNAVVALEVEVYNHGSEGWGSTGLRPVCICYHWLDRSGEMAVFDGQRSALPYDVQPNKMARLWATVKAPSVPGDYHLVLTLVQEWVGWFEQAGGAAQTVPIRVEQDGTCS